jgi:TolB protein
MRWLVAAAVLVTAAAHGAPASPERHGSIPAVSPDGRHIAFLSDRDGGTSDLYVVGADGKGERRLTRSEEQEAVPSWTNRGMSVTFMTMRGDSTTLWAEDLDGSGRRILASLPAKGFALSNDGGRIAYTVGTWTRNRIVVADRDGGHATAITDSSAGYFNLAWSPEGGRIAVTRLDVSRDLQVWVMNADGSGARALTRFPASDGRPQWPAWSPDGRTIAVQSGAYDRQNPANSTAHLWTIDVASGAAKRLAPHPKPYLDETPSWFPDGNRIAFQSDRTGRMEIWVMNADGGRPRQVTR